jgi:hypothetical protein
MLELAVAIGTATVAGTFLATLGLFIRGRRDWGKREPGWAYSLGDSFGAALFTIPAGILWVGLPGLLGFGLAGEGGALAAVIAMAVLDALGLAFVAVITSPAGQGEP